jgi:hypothetical protein
MEKITNMQKGLAATVLLLIAFACNKEGGTGKQIEEIKTDGKISSIVRSPISADGTVDTVNVAKMAFEQTVYEFGEVDEGATVKHEFKFTNTGKQPLLIQNAHSTCGCTVPDWPKDVIPPGQTGIIKVEFDTKGKTELQEKSVIITANTYPSVTRLYLKGIVNKLGGGK